MSAPNTNPEKQVRRHRTPIYAMVVIVLLTILGFVFWLGDETQEPQMPGTEPVTPTELPVPEGQPAVQSPTDQP